MNDCLFWKWTTHRTYSAISFYNIISYGGKIKWDYRYTWNLHIPPTVKIFAYLCLQGKLLTHDVMEVRGFTCEMSCTLCQSCNIETAAHLFFQCEHATIVWRRVAWYLGYRLMCRGESVQDMVLKSSWKCARQMTRRKWGVFFFSACWRIWKERNHKIFEKSCAPPIKATEGAMKEALLWLRYC